MTALNMALQERIQKVEALFAEAEKAEQRGRLKDAYQLYTQAHDSVLGCPRLHKEAHQHLIRVNWKLGHFGEFVSDAVVLTFARVGLLEVIAYFSKEEGRVSDACKR